MPIVRGSAVEGVLPVSLDNFTSFGSWVCRQVVLYAHQKVSRVPEYHEDPSLVPGIVFKMIEDLAVSYRPFFHPIYLDRFRFVFQIHFISSSYYHFLE